jgi:pilus assembly protein CpaE
MALPSVPRAMSGPMPELLFCSPDRAVAQRLTAKLQSIGKVRWETDSSSLWLTQHSGERGPVLLDFCAAQANASSALARELIRLLPQLPLVAVGSGSAEQASGVLAALRAGVHDFIDLDAPAEEARSVLRQIREKHPAAAIAPVPRRRARVVAILGVRAGVGGSTLAAHLGVLAQRQLSPVQQTIPQGDHVLLLDLGHPWGDGQLYLGVHGEFHYEDAVRHASRIDGTLTRSAFPRHASELAVLSHAGQQGIATPDDGDADLLERLRGLFDLILVDHGGRADLGPVPVSLLEADEVWLVTDPSVGAALSLDIALRRLLQSGVTREAIRLIVNRHDDGTALEPDQISARFELPLIAVLPERSRALRASAAQGRLLHDISPRDPYVRSLAPLIARLLPNMVPAASRRRHRWLSGLADMLGGRRWTRM